MCEFLTPQVMYSSTWTSGTRAEFARAVSALSSSRRDLCRHTAEVRAFLDHWSAEPFVSLQEARQKWTALQRGDEGWAILACAREEDSLDACTLVLTGDLHARCGDRKRAKIECASTPMFACPRGRGTKARNECVYQTIDEKWFVERARQRESQGRSRESLLPAIRGILLDKVSNLAEMVRAGHLSIELHQGELSPRGIKAQLEEGADNGLVGLDRLRAMDADSVSWSNYMDYMSLKTFHLIASSVAPRAAHSGYSMNWMHQCTLRVLVLCFIDD